MAGKGPIIIMILRILVALGWLAFFIYNFYLWKLLVNDYGEDPSSFVFFESEQDRTAYKENSLALNPANYFNTDWIDRAALVDQCRPMIYFKDFYFNKIDPIVSLMFLLVVLTIAIKIPINEWIAAKTKIKKTIEKIEKDSEEEEDEHNK